MREFARGRVPRLMGLVADDEGSVWMADYNPADFRSSPRHRVVSSAGEWIGLVEVPPRFEILDIGRDFILGIERDALGVQAVALYGIER